jgi:hypothetical protein
LSTLTNSHAAPPAVSDPYAGRMPMPAQELAGESGGSGMTSADGGVMASPTPASGGSGGGGGGGGSWRHMAMPQLLGAPAYARPPRIVAETPRPLDPDDLPIEAMRSPEDEARLSGAYQQPAGDLPPTIKPSSQGGLRAVASRLFGSGS